MNRIELSRVRFKDSVFLANQELKDATSTHYDLVLLDLAVVMVTHRASGDQAVTHASNLQYGHVAPPAPPAPATQANAPGKQATNTNGSGKRSR